GLPAGQMGNSEVGHQNLGAGRIVYQSLTRISKAIREGEFDRNPELLSFSARLNSRNGRLHLLGLISDGGVHSHLDHLVACVRFAKLQGIEHVYIHAFMDGRDTSPTSGVGFLREIEEKIAAIGVGSIATVIGRYYA